MSEIMKNAHIYFPKLSNYVEVFMGAKFYTLAQHLYFFFKTISSRIQKVLGFTWVLSFGVLQFSVLVFMPTRCYHCYKDLCTIAITDNT